MSVVLVAVLGLTGCNPDAEPGAISSLKGHVIGFEEYLTDMLRSNRVPEVVSRELGPGTTVISGEPGQILRNKLEGDTVTIEILQHAYGFTGGGWFSDTSDVYLCLTYVLEPHEGTFTRAESKCPAPPNKVAELVTIRELDLDPLGE
jgi:hypothetical protein